MVVVADHGDGAIRYQVHHGIDRPLRIGAIADDIAEADDALGAAGARGIQAGAERLPVGVDVRKDRQTHVPSDSIIAPVLALVLRDIKLQAACGRQSRGRRAWLHAPALGTPASDDD